MNIFTFISLGLCIATGIKFALAMPEAVAEPEPLVGNEMESFCKSRIADVRKHQYLCRFVAKTVVEKASHACEAAVKHGCELASFAWDSEPCQKKMDELICQLRGTPSTNVSECTAKPNYLTQLKKFVKIQCSEHLKKLAGQRAVDGNESTDDSENLCKGLSEAAKKGCTWAFEGILDLLPLPYSLVKKVFQKYALSYLCE